MSGSEPIWGTGKFYKWILRIFVLAIIFILLFNIQVYSGIRGPHRTLFETNVGYGFPELICLKIKVGSDIAAGLFQAFDTHGFGTTGVEIYYRFGEKPRLQDQKPWYVMGGLGGYLFDVDYIKEYKLIFFPRAGRSFNFTKNTGLNLDIGFGFPISRNAAAPNLISPVLLTGSMCLFFRF